MVFWIGLNIEISSQSQPNWEGAAVSSTQVLLRDYWFIENYLKALWVKATFCSLQGQLPTKILRRQPWKLLPQKRHLVVYFKNLALLSELLQIHFKLNSAPSHWFKMT